MVKIIEALMMPKLNRLNYEKLLYKQFGFSKFSGIDKSKRNKAL